MKRASIFAFVFLFILFVFSMVSVKSLSLPPDVDMFELQNFGLDLVGQESQYNAINYYDGYQLMLLTINTSEELKEGIAWIFPIPAKSNEITADVIKGFPELTGYNLEREKRFSMEAIFMAMIFTQLYPIPPFLLLRTTVQASSINELKNLEVYTSVDKMGLFIELVSAKNSDQLNEYLYSKNLTLPEGSISVLSEYFEEEYSFVVFWISNVEDFKKEQEYNSFEREYSGRYWERSRNVLSILIKFPTKKIYYPLRINSVYGDKKAPTIIYVMDYVEPELYDSIKGSTKISYFFQSGNEKISEELGYFFLGHKREPFEYFSRINDSDGIQERKGYYLNSLEYTKIRVNPTSEYLTEDLWMEISIPERVRRVNFENNYLWIYGLIFFMIFSSLASFLSGIIVFRKDKNISKVKLMLFGLWNFLSLAGFISAAYLSKIGLKNKKKNVPILKIIIKTLKVSLVFVFLISVIRISLSGSGIYLSIPTFILIFLSFVFLSLFISPFVSIYYEDKGMMWKIIRRTFVVSLITVIALSFLLTLLTKSWIYIPEMIFPIIILYIFLSIFLAPFVFGYYQNRKAMIFIILFNIFFMIITISSYLLFLKFF